MQRNRYITCLLMTFFLTSKCFAANLDGTFTAPTGLDLLILNGTVVDGTGKPSFIADIAVDNGRIVAINEKLDIAAKRTIDAQGLIVAPGFIDSHSHADVALTEARNKMNESSITQGITTIVIGADGEFSPEDLTRINAVLKNQGVGTNLAFYVGHNGIRNAVLGNKQNRAPTAIELAQMSALVRQGMLLGAVGFSTGLMYEPGRHSDTDEVVALASQVREFGGVYDSHVRDPINNLLASDLEAIEIAERSQVAGKIAHVKAVCLQNAGKSRNIVELVESYRAKGLNIVTDQYPYDGAKTAYLSSLIELTETQAATYGSIKDALLVESLRKIIQHQSEQGLAGQFSWLKTVGYSCIRITESEDYPHLVGRYLSQVAAEKKIDNFSLLTELLINAKHPIQVTLGGIDEYDVQNILTQPWNMIVTDGQYVNNLSSFDNHPRSTGSFTKVIRHYVKELNLLTLPLAIHKMTYQPALFLGLADRGVIREGAVADIVIFDFDKITDHSSYQNPLPYSTGINFLLVNGALTIDQGKISDIPSGKILKREIKTKYRLNDR